MLPSKTGFRLVKFTPQRMNDRYFVEALARGLQVLEAFSEAEPSLTLTEIISIVELNKSTVFRLVHTLESLGYLKRDPETKRYRPALKVLQLGFTALNSLEMAEIARPYLRTLSAQCGETTNMTIRDGAEIVYIVRNKTQQIFSVNLQLGSRLPVYCTSMGKAQLIDLSPQELSDLLGDGPYPKLGPNTITTLEALVDELARVREQGYAINDEELAAGLLSVAAPVRDHSGQIVAAINVSMPRARSSQQEVTRVLAPRVVRTAHEISLALGARA
ncbi:MAG: IclR family transcriptional regulator [Chloroflexi bacterium]|nr:MAG: IclR family transcriptional regulator [Chloroflexota bacterium]